MERTPEQLKEGHVEMKNEHLQLHLAVCPQTSRTTSFIMTVVPIYLG